MLTAFLDKDVRKHYEDFAEASNENNRMVVEIRDVVRENNESAGEGVKA